MNKYEQLLDNANNKIETASINSKKDIEILINDIEDIRKIYSDKAKLYSDKTKLCNVEYCINSALYNIVEYMKLISDKHIDSQTYDKTEREIKQFWRRIYRYFNFNKSFEFRKQLVRIKKEFYR